MNRVLGIDHGEARIGLAVEVIFIQAGDVWLPLFRPATAGKAE